MGWLLYWHMKRQTYHSGAGLFSRSRMSTALTMTNRLTPAAAVASKTLTAPIVLKSACNKMYQYNLRTFVVYSLGSLRATTSSPCTPNHYVRTVLLDSCREVVDTRVFDALHDWLGSQCFEFGDLGLLADDRVDSIGRGHQLGCQMACNLVSSRYQLLSTKP